MKYVHTLRALTLSALTLSVACERARDTLPEAEQWGPKPAQTDGSVDGAAEVFEWPDVGAVDDLADGGSDSVPDVAGGDAASPPRLADAAPVRPATVTCATHAVALPGFVCVDPTAFQRGRVDDLPPNEPEVVVLNRPYYIGETEVTQGQWFTVMGDQPSIWAERGPCADFDCPVEMVSWYDALAYANRLSESEGLAPCYALDDCRGVPGDRSFTCRAAAPTAGAQGVDCVGYRLPTDAEWERAARAGGDTAFGNGPLTGELGCAPNTDLDPVLGRMGIYCVNAPRDATWPQGYPTPVGQLEPNAFGLFDMHGNVMEWVFDTVPQDQAQRFLRGGSWDRDAASATVIWRGTAHPDTRFGIEGFRLARSVLP